MAEAQALEGIYQTYKDQDFITISAWSEDDQGALPTTEVLMGWANQFGITSPVVADPDSALYWRFGQGGLPQSALLGPGAEVLKIGHITADDIESALQ